MTVLTWLISGLIIGAIAKLLMPGNDPGGIVVTMLIGVAGSIVGGYLGRVMGLYGPGQYGGFFMSILGALVLLFLYRQFTRTRA